MLLWYEMQMGENHIKRFVGKGLGCGNSPFFARRFSTLPVVLLLAAALGILSNLQVKNTVRIGLTTKTVSRRV